MNEHTEPLELRYLIALAAIGREGSFSRAAESLGYTQSAISQQISRLERLVGQKLVERPGGPRPISLTAAGQLLLGHASAITARLDSARADLRALSDGESGVLRIGCYQSVGAHFLPRVLKEFCAAWPKVTIKLTEAEDDLELLHLVERGELDLTFVVYPMPAGPFAHLELFEDPYVAVVSRDSELGRDGGEVHPRELVGLPIVTYARMREVHSIERRLGWPELGEGVLFRSNNNGTILGLAAAGIGVAVISRLSVDPARTDMRTVSLAGVSPRIVGIAWHHDRYRLPASEAFVRLAQQAAVYAMSDSDS